MNCSIGENKNNYPIKEILLLPLIITSNLLKKEPMSGQAEEKRL
jgi:hypothetical protein